MPVYKIKDLESVEDILSQNYELFNLYTSLILPPDRIIYSKTKISDEIVENKFDTTPKIIRLGFEFEFMLNSNYIPEHLWEKYHIKREYYHSMFELNNFFYTINFGNIKKIYKQLLKIVNNIYIKLLQFKKDMELEGLYPDFTPKAIDIQEGLAFNGMHLHLSFVTQNKKRFKLLKNIEPKIIYYKNTINPTPRSILSHHIWGAYRESEYRFKQQKRYQPIIYTYRNTIEFRCFDYLDLFNKKMLKLFAILLYKIYTKEEIKITKQEKLFFEKLQNLNGDYELDEVEDILNSIKEVNYE